MQHCLVFLGEGKTLPACWAGSFWWPVLTLFFLSEQDPGHPRGKALKAGISALRLRGRPATPKQDLDSAYRALQPRKRKFAPVEDAPEDSGAPQPGVAQLQLSQGAGWAEVAQQLNQLIRSALVKLGWHMTECTRHARCLLAGLHGLTSFSVSMPAVRTHRAGVRLPSRKRTALLQWAGGRGSWLACVG